MALNGTTYYNSASQVSQAFTYTSWNAVTSICSLPETDAFATTGEGGIKIWNRSGIVEDVQPEQLVDSPLLATVSSDGKTFASAGGFGGLSLWDRKTGRIIRHLHEPRGTANRVQTLRFSTDGRMLATGSRDGYLRVWDLQSTNPLVFESKHQGIVTSVDISTNGDRVVSAYSDGVATLWDVKSGTEIQSFAGHNLALESVLLLKDGKTTITGGLDATIRIWDAEAGIERHQLHGHSARVRCLSMSPDGQIFASGSVDNTVKLWSLDPPECLETFRGHSMALSDVVFSPDGNTLASASDDGSVKLWEVRGTDKPDVIQGEPREFGFRFTATPDRSTVVFPVGHDLKFCDLLNNHQRILKNIDTSQELAVAPNGSMVAIAQADHTVVVRDAVSGAELSCLRGHTGKVQSISFSPDGNFLVTGSKDTTVRLWDIQNDHQARSVRFYDFDEGRTRQLTGRCRCLFGGWYTNGCRCHLWPGSDLGRSHQRYCIEDARA